MIRTLHTALLALVTSTSLQAAAIYDGFGDVSGLTDVSVTVSGVTTVYGVTFTYGTFNDVYGSGIPSGWPFADRDQATAATYGLAEAMRAASLPGSALFAGGDDSSYVPYYVGPVPGAAASCANCVAARGVDYWIGIGSTPLWYPTVSTYLIQFPENHAWQHLAKRSSCQFQPRYGYLAPHCWA